MRKFYESVVPYCKDDFDFTNFDIDEDTFDKLVADFHAMSVDQEELDSLGLNIKNSLHGPYGIYSTGTGIPDIVLNDFETPLRVKPYRYTIRIYQIQEDSSELYDEVYEYLLRKIESGKELNESVLNESAGEKSFDEVEEGDIGEDYSGNEVIILAKGPASNFSDADGFEQFVDLSDYDPEDVDFNNQIDAEWPECVLVEFVEDGSEVVYSYGSDGVVVPQKGVRQISFDFIDTGKVADSDLLLTVRDAMTRIGLEVVGGPQFGDTSWSKKEYGLNEEIIGRGKYGIEVKDPRDLWVPASENYPRNGEPAEFKKEDDAKNSDLYKRLVDRYGKNKVRTYKQDRPKN